MLLLKNWICSSDPGRRTLSCWLRLLKIQSPLRFIFLGRQTTSPVLSGNQWKKSLDIGKRKKSQKHILKCLDLMKNIICYNFLNSYVHLQESNWRTGEQRCNKARKRSPRNAMLTFPLCQQLGDTLLTFPICQQCWLFHFVNTFSQSVDNPER